MKEIEFFEADMAGNLLVEELTDGGVSNPSKLKLDKFHGTSSGCYLCLLLILKY